MEISEKSRACQRGGVAMGWRAQHTLSVQEVADRHEVGSVGDIGSLEDLLHMCLRLDAHVLLTERASLLLDVGMLLVKLVQARSQRRAGPASGDGNLQAAPTEGPS